MVNDINIAGNGMSLQNEKVLSYTKSRSLRSVDTVLGAGYGYQLLVFSDATIIKVPTVAC